MKRSEIKAGVVYGIRQSFGDPDPVVFLEDAGATVWQDNNHGELAFEPAGTGQRPGKDSLYGTRGYAVVRHLRGGTGTFPAALASMRTLDVAAELARFRVARRRTDDGPSSPLLEFGVITTLNKVAGPYDDAVADRQAQRDREDRARDESDRRSRAESEHGKAIVAGLAELGIKAHEWSDTGRYTVRLELDEADQLLAALKRAGAVAANASLAWERVAGILTDAGYPSVVGRDDGEGFAVAQVTADSVDIGHITPLQSLARLACVHQALEGYRAALEAAGLMVEQASASQDYLTVVPPNG